MTIRPAILITGAARRVGAALARHFTAGGYEVGLHYNASETEAKALQKELGCALFRQDVSDIAALPAFMTKVQAAMPNCVALINNASVFERAAFMETDEALFDRQFTTNFKAPFFLTQAFAKTFGKGSVINILDTEIVQTQGSHFAYLLSKKALAEFTVMAARELGANIRVNGVCPGIMLPSNELDQAYMERLSQELPMEGLATPEQVASSCQWLCESGFTTGQLLFCDGGQHLL